MENLYYTIDDFVQAIGSGCGDDVSSLSIVYTIGTMRSARERRLNGYDEFPYEVFAQYLMTGKVTFHRFADPLVIKAKSGDIVCKYYPTHEANVFLTRMEDSLNRQCAKILASLRGKVVVL